MPDAVATSYGPPWGGIQGTGITATGINLAAAPHELIVAVDPSVVPLGSKLKIWPNPFGDPNLIFTAADTGGAIKGAHFDFYDWRGRAQQTAWGIKNVVYSIVGKGSPQDAATYGGQTTGAAAASPSTKAAASGGGGWLDTVKRDLLKGFLELAFVAGGAVVIGAGARRAANSTETGRRAIAGAKKVGKRVAEAELVA